jgi:RNA polymerase sigma factor (sigma-70 family)
VSNDPVQDWLDNASRYPLLPKAEMIRLAKNRDALDKKDPGYDKKYLRIINKLCLHNLRLVPKVVKIYVRKKGSMTMNDHVVPDLLQYGYTGLRRAAERYDGTRGYAFSTYAVPWIRQAVQRQGHVATNMIYVPEGTFRAALHYKATGEFQQVYSTTAKNPRLIQAACQAAVCTSLDSLSICSNNKFERDGDRVIDAISEENRIIKNEESIDASKVLVNLINKMGLPEDEAALMIAYGKAGRIEKAARIIGMNIDEARAKRRKTMAKMQRYVKRLEEEKRQQWHEYLSR